MAHSLVLKPESLAPGRCRVFLIVMKSAMSAICILSPACDSDSEAGYAPHSFWYIFFKILISSRECYKLLAQSYDLYVEVRVGCALACPSSRMFS